MAIIQLPYPSARAYAPSTIRSREVAEVSGNLAPVLEGARARGVADAFEITGQGAVLLSASGEILHLTGAARRLMAGKLEMCGGHLVAEASVPDSGRISRALGRIIGDALAGGDGVETILEVGGGRLRFKAVAFPGGESNVYQLLKAFLLVDADPAVA